MEIAERILLPIGNGWIKVQELLPFLTSRAPPLEMKGRVYARCIKSSMSYVSETMPLLADVELKFKSRCADRLDGYAAFP